MSRGHPRLRWPPTISADGEDILKQFPNQICFGQLRAGAGDTLGAYEGLLSALKDKGYSVANDNLLFFTYNGIQSNAKSGAELKIAVDAFLKRFNLLFGTTHDTVDVIGHSVGALVARVSIGNGSKIRRTANVATPHYGSPKAYFALHPDIDNGGGGPKPRSICSTGHLTVTNSTIWTTPCTNSPRFATASTSLCRTDLTSIMSKCCGWNPKAGPRNTSLAPGKPISRTNTAFPTGWIGLPGGVCGFPKVWGRRHPVTTC